MVSAVLALGLASVPVRTVEVSRDGEPLRVVCPVNHPTTIVFPEPMRQLKAPGAGAALGLSIERTRPQGTIVVRPSSHPASATLEFRGPTLALRLLVETSEEGQASEVHLVLAAESAVAAAEPSPEGPPATDAPEPLPAPITAAPAPSGPPATTPATAAPPASPFDLEGVLRAKSVSIGRREGLPGQRPMVLVDALQGERWVWFRFALEGGAQSRVARIFWEKGDVASYVQEPDGKDLRLVVQIPRDTVAERAHLSLEVESGPTYTFALNAGSLGRFLKELFR